MRLTTLILAVVVSYLSACAHFDKTGQRAPVSLGNSESEVVDKMVSAGARDVTGLTDRTYYAAVSSEQRYYWWELADKTIVAVLLTGTTNDDLAVRTIETGEPGLGIDGLEYWRSQNLTLETSLPPRFPRQRQNKGGDTDA